MAKHQKKWTEEEDNLLRQHYSIQNKDFIMSLFNNQRGWAAIGKHANFLSLPRRMIATNSGVNFRFFDEWSESMAYVLGFMAADGCISDKGFLQINLSYKDLNHLVKIRDLLYPGKPIYEHDSKASNGKYYRHCLLSIGSKYMISRLIDLGITARKSLTLGFPINIPNEYMRHFVRGYFDGDGCICRNTLSIDIIGTERFLDSLSNIISKELLISKANIMKKFNANAYDIKYSTKSAVKIIEWMYGDSSIYLDRKYALYCEKISKWSNRRSEWSLNEDNILVGHYNKTNVSITDIMAMLDNRTAGSIYHRASRLGIVRG